MCLTMQGPTIKDQKKSKKERKRKNRKQQTYKVERNLYNSCILLCGNYNNGCFWSYFWMFQTLGSLFFFFLTSFCLKKSGKKKEEDDNVNLCNLVNDNQKWFVRCAIARGVFLGSRFKETKMTFFYFYFVTRFLIWWYQSTVDNVMAGEPGSASVPCKQSVLPFQMFTIACSYGKKKRQQNTWSENNALSKVHT